jgi:peptidoglycan/LPS O-acetylase OafA/YrhL
VTALSAPSGFAKDVAYVTTSGTSRFPGLDVLRGVAALSVALLHARDALGAPWLMQSGAMAVDLFFAMSGFVIAHAYDNKMQTLGARGFIRVRAIRFYPFYLLGLALGILRLVATKSLGSGADELANDGIVISFVLALMFLPAPMLYNSQGSISPLNGPAWSLLFEMWINALYAVFFRLLSTPTLVLVIVLAAAGLVSETAAGHIGGGANWRDLMGGIARVCYSFPLGVLLYRHREKLPVMSNGFAVAALAVAIGFFMTEPSPYTNLLFIVVVSPMLLIGTAHASFNVKFAAYCGVMSYCLYAIHVPLIVLSTGFANRLGFPKQWMVAIAIVAIIAAAPVLDRIYDRPFRNLLSRLSQGLKLFSAQ